MPILYSNRTFSIVVIKHVVYSCSDGYNYKVNYIRAEANCARPTLPRKNGVSLSPYEYVKLKVPMEINAVLVNPIVYYNNSIPAINISS